jgi:hypothetical protein
VDSKGFSGAFVQNPKTFLPAGEQMTHAWQGFIELENSGVIDSWKEPVRNVVGAWTKPYGTDVPTSTQDAGWLPSKRFAEAWLTFEKTREHPITRLE